MSQRTGLVRAAQQLATHYSAATGNLLESLVREVPLSNAQQVLELVRRVDEEARRPVDAAQQVAPHGTPERLATQSR